METESNYEEMLREVLSWSCFKQRRWSQLALKLRRELGLRIQEAEEEAWKIMKEKDK